MLSNSNNDRGADCMLEYFELNELLTNVEAAVRAAECHGFLCGQICVHDSPPEELWQEFIEAQTEDVIELQNCYREITVLTDDILDNIQSSDLDFLLLLPADDNSLTDRAAALAEWCHGFLNGYGVGAGSQVLTAECREILEDYAKICRVSVAEANIEEEDEQALYELIEYVRMGAIHMYAEHMAEYRTADEPEAIH